MKNERILPYAMATKLGDEDIGSVSGGLQTTINTTAITYTVNNGSDVITDVAYDT